MRGTKSPALVESQTEKDRKRAALHLSDVAFFLHIDFSHSDVVPDLDDEAGDLHAGADDQSGVDVLDSVIEGLIGIVEISLRVYFEVEERSDDSVNVHPFVELRNPPLMRRKTGIWK